MDLIPFVGEPLALDLVNTRPLTGEGRVDLLETGEGLRLWLESEAERIPVLSAAESAAIEVGDFRPIIAVRDYITSAITHLRDGKPVPIKDIDGLNAAMRAAPVMSQLVWSDRPVLSSERVGAPTIRLAGFLAEDAAALLAGGEAALIRKCAAEDCVMLFVGTNTRRRWCSAARCGNRVRVSRYYQRSKMV
ncbi:CGNR zinc finger domain-containing protein [Rhizobium sp. PL01]|uniref:CGNR zinc finger domain-containing protein n=1 Tax=Rhizobium sp. PL01 TaxID=3085631 RepID=UPI0029827F96|nr:ABATE domain-containing protein [Rhizobium sp. PL01]MDW5314529.1 ABATE domain-containing protein [Rhizobium sp. PL01]